MPEKHAVLVIHGIGEQVPMGTLREFVKAVWTHGNNHPSRQEPWSKPDTISKSYELRRLSTPRNENGIQTDFFEFYWADLMKGTTLSQVIQWSLSLILRRPAAVPNSIKTAYWTARVLALGFIALVGLVSALYLQWISAPSWIAHALTILTLCSGIWAYFSNLFILRIVGDAARYLHIAPTNIQCRHKIRRRGVELLRELHEHERHYDRIIIVGHSLGSVIGYDILTHAWAEFNRDPCRPEYADKALKELESWTHQLSSNSDTTSSETLATRTQILQRKYAKELIANGNRWRVTDFITMGSPLAHAGFLLATSPDDLKARQEIREFPTCPPTLETTGEATQRFSYCPTLTDGASVRYPHHAAVFGPVCWTNLYFPSQWLIKGDFISGPISGVMGHGVRDLQLKTTLRHGLFTHTLYWAGTSRDSLPEHVAQLRNVLGLEQPVHA